MTMRKVEIKRPTWAVRVWFTWRGFMLWGNLRGRRFYRSKAWAPFRYEDEA